MDDFKIIVRKAIEPDLLSVKGIFDQNKRELGFWTYNMINTSFLLNEIFVAECGTTVVGVCVYHCRKDDRVTLYGIATQAEYRRRGVGALLIEALKAEATRRKKTKIVLKCPQDIPANTFYKRLGFSVINTEQSKRSVLNVYCLTLLNCSGVSTES